MITNHTTFPALNKRSEHGLIQQKPSRMIHLVLFHQAPDCNKPSDETLPYLTNKPDLLCFL
eukprot:782838-Pelagomonas_calceolata.AAC.1